MTLSYFDVRAALIKSKPAPGSHCVRAKPGIRSACAHVPLYVHLGYVDAQSMSLPRYVLREHAPKRVSWTFAPHHVVAFARNSTSAGLWSCGRRRKRRVARGECFTSESARDRDERYGRGAYPLVRSSDRALRLPWLRGLRESMSTKRSAYAWTAGETTGPTTSSTSRPRHSRSRPRWGTARRATDRAGAR
jgi:hypothetical protein